MLNYIKGEVYRNFNRVYFWAFTIGLSILTLVFNVMLKLENSSNFISKAGLSAYIYIIVFMLLVPVFFIPVFIDMSTTEEYKNLTLRNVVTFGVNRTQIVLSKFIVSSILAFSSGAIIVTTLLGSGVILFGVGTEFGDIKANIIKILVASILWGGAIAVGIFLALILKHNNIFAIVYIMIFGASNLVLKGLIEFKFKNLKCIQDVLITTQLIIIREESATNNQLIVAALIGAIYIIVFLTLSSLWFNKQEVK